MSLAGKTIADYHIHSKLGSGGLGVVYKARDAKRNRLVALKFLPPEVATDPEARERFKSEAMATSDLRHPNICAIHEINETDEGHLFIVMTYYEGETLEVKLQGRHEAMDFNREAWGLRGVPTAVAAGASAGATQDPLADVVPLGAETETDEGEVESRLPDKPVVPVEETIGIIRQIGQGLAAAHAEGIFHRDMKPSNIIVGKDGTVVILDFGMAHLGGQAIGSPTYMPPEQIRGGRVDHQSDLWATGAMLYHMVSGRAPFPGDYDEAIIYNILNEEPAEIENEGVSPIVRQALMKDKFERYSAAGDLVADLVALERGEEDEEEVEEVAPLTPTKPLWLYGAVAAAVIIVLAILIF